MARPEAISTEPMASTLAAPWRAIIRPVQGPRKAMVSIITVRPAKAISLASPRSAAMARPKTAGIS